MTTFTERQHLNCAIYFPDKACTWLGDTSDVRKPRDYEGPLWPWLIRVAATLLAVALCMVAPNANAETPSTPTTNGDILAAAMLYLDGPPSHPVSYLAIGGNFTRITTTDGTSHPARNLAVINTVNGKLVYAGDVDSYVYALGAVNSTLYVGGRFTSIDGKRRNQAAAISTDDWHVKPWAPVVGSGIVTAVAYSDTAVFLGSSNAVAAYDQQAGRRLWAAPTVGGPVRTLLAQHATGVLYVGGLFGELLTPAGRFVQQGLAALTMGAGRPVPAFRPVLRPNTHIGPSGGYDGQNPLSLAWDGLRNRIVVGIASVHTNGLMSFDQTTGEKRSDVPTNGDCQAVAVLAGGRYYFAGFHNSNAYSVNPLRFAGMWSPDTGWSDWRGPDGPNGASDDGGNGGVQAVAFDWTSETLYVAGAFTQPAVSLTAYRIGAS